MFDAKSWSAQRYQQRKAAGLCVACGEQPAQDASAYCVGCLDKQRARQQATAKKLATAKKAAGKREAGTRKTQGVCTVCEGELLTLTHCRRCEAIRLVKQKGLTRYAARLQVGLCTHCDEIAAGPRCTTCQDKRAGQWRDRKQAGLCGVCGETNDRDGMSTCSKCSVDKVTLYAERRDQGLCPHCGSDEPIEPGKHCLRCRAINRKKDRKKHGKLRAEVLAAYGGTCKCCGETQPEFLQVDHVNNNGASHRRELFGGNKNGCGLRFYTWLRRQKFPQQEYQLLCANCNRAKHHYGVCPHQRLKAEA